MDDVNLYENSQALGTSGRQQLLYQYANLSKPRGRNALGKMEAPAQGAPPLARMSNGAAPAPRQQRQRQLPESNFGQPRRSHERAQHQQSQQISRSQEREYYMMQQQQQQQQQQHYQQVRRQQPMDPF